RILDGQRAVEPAVVDVGESVASHCRTAGLLEIAAGFAIPDRFAYRVRHGHQRAAAEALLVLRLERVIAGGPDVRTLSEERLKLRPWTDQLGAVDRGLRKRAGGDHAGKWMWDLRLQRGDETEVLIRHLVDLGGPARGKTDTRAPRVSHFQHSFLSEVALDVEVPLLHVSGMVAAPVGSG